MAVTVYFEFLIENSINFLYFARMHKFIGEGYGKIRAEVLMLLFVKYI